MLCSLSLQLEFGSSLTVKRLPRRMLLQFMGFNPILLCAYPIIAAPMPEMKEPKVIRTFKLASGVRIQEIIEGEGSKAHEGDLVEVNYLCRRSNGYFVHRVSQQVEFWSFVIFIWQCSEITVLGT
ncbi:peptidyl-prolyl cis-trans isomerase FKBP16-1, chloroplastic isoform X3 [Fagus crenata]